MFKWFFPILICSSLHAQAVRLRCEREDKNGNVYTSHGTAWVTDKGCVTAWHVIEDADFIYAEHAGEGWILCVVRKIDKSKDLALIEPRIDIPNKVDAAGLWCFGAARGKKIKQMKAEIKEDNLAVIDGFDHGCSGAPIVRDGVLVGICVAMVGPTVLYRPAAIVEAFLK